MSVFPDPDLQLRAALHSGLQALDFLHLSAPEHERILSCLVTYLRLIEKWNRVYNLTAVRDPMQMVMRHIIDSLLILPYLGDQGERVLDVGTGAGLPGIPLSLVLPHKNFTLLDSVQKKQIFLQHVVQSLSLPNVALACVRVEDYKPTLPFHTIVSRAFAPLGKMLDLTGHLLAPQGRFLAMKGKLDPDELKSIGSDYKIDQVVDLSLFSEKTETEQRHLVVVMRN